MDESELEPLPHWAIKPSLGSYYELMGSLPTKDGRRTGNAVVVDVIEKTYKCTEDQIFKLIKVVTDAGNILLLTELEAEELFHRPQYVMMNMLKAHCQALEDEAAGI